MEVPPGDQGRQDRHVERAGPGRLQARRGVARRRELNARAGRTRPVAQVRRSPGRSEEHTSELQSLMRISYAVFCLKKKTNSNTKQNNKSQHNITNNNTQSH